MEKHLTLFVNLVTLAGKGVVSGARRVADATTPWVLIPVALLLAGAYLVASDRAKQRVNTAGRSAVSAVAGAVIAYGEVRERFNRATPKVPGWNSLSEMNPPGAVLGRACIRTLARRPQGERSAEELAQDLPYLGVAQSEAEVRQMLRETGSFAEVWRGRWQVGYAAPVVLRYLQQRSDTASA